MRPILLIRLVPTALGIEIFLQPLGCQQQPLGPRACDRVGLLPAALLELALGVAQPALPPLDPGDDPLRIELLARRCLRVGLQLLGVRRLPVALLLGLPEELAATLRRAQLLGQLIPARITVQLVLGLVGRLRLGEDLPRDLLELTVRLTTCVPRQAGAVDRDQPRRHQPSLITQPQHLTEQLRQRRLVPNDEPRDRRVIRHHVPRDHPVRHVLTTVTLDRARGTLLGRVRVHQQSHR